MRYSKSYQNLTKEISGPLKYTSAGPQQGRGKRGGCLGRQLAGSAKIKKIKFLISSKYFNKVNVVQYVGYYVDSNSFWIYLYHYFNKNINFNSLGNNSVSSGITLEGVGRKFCASPIAKFQLATALQRRKEECDVVVIAVVVYFVVAVQFNPV